MLLVKMAYMVHTWWRLLVGQDFLGLPVISTMYKSAQVSKACQVLSCSDKDLAYIVPTS